MDCGFPIRMRTFIINYKSGKFRFVRSRLADLVIRMYRYITPASQPVRVASQIP
jgi:hypothetical protein